MPNTRENLIELLTQVAVLGDYLDMRKVADHLIANGATINRGTDDTPVGDKVSPTDKPRFLVKENGDIVPLTNCQQWISVNDRLPTEESKSYEKEWEDYPEYLVMIDGGLLPTTLYYDWENDEWFRINTALRREIYKVTHWMPLPEPPKGE